MRIILTFCVLLLSATIARAGNWPAWRGPSADGISDEKQPPETWSATENVTWKTPLPGEGNSTPIIWGDRIFITCAARHGAVRSVICFDRATGKQLWTGDTSFDRQEATHADNPYCSSSPITDGKTVFAWLGSAGVVAYDFSGKQLWKTDVGLFHHIWGNAASPVFYNETLILNCGPGDNCFLVALDKQTGRQVWRHDLPDAVGKPEEFKGSWSSPLICTIGGSQQLIVALPDRVASFNPDTGEELWRCRGLGALAYANPLVGKETIVAMSGYGGPALGMRTPSATDRGDLTTSHRLWVATNNPQRIGSGIMLGIRVYMIAEPGIAQCIDALTGKIIWKARAAGSTWGSTVLIDGKFFTTDQSGETIVWLPGDELKILQQNKLSEHVRATPVFSDGQVFIRTYENLYCIGKRRAE